MKRSFVLSGEARIDVKEILGDIADDKPDTADRLKSDLFLNFSVLAQSPGIGHFYDELLSRKFRFWNFYSFVIVYAWNVKPIRLLQWLTEPATF